MPASITSYIDVGIDEFEDDELIEEIRRRGLVVSHVAPAAGDDKPEPVDVRKAAIDVMEGLLAKQYRRADAALEALLAAILPPQLVAAAAAMREGRHSDAICELDRLIEPSPAATATSLPPRVPAAEARQ
ncbi:MAG: hypothetical protein ACOYLQ_09705 [Hyphomicrobiaceae bacterium]